MRPVPPSPVDDGDAPSAYPSTWAGFLDWWADNGTVLDPDVVPVNEQLPVQVDVAASKFSSH